MEVQQSQCFQSLEQSQRDLLTTLTIALRNDHDQFEAIAEQHAVVLGNLVTREHERTRALGSEDAKRTRRLVSTKHEDALTHMVEQHITTREVAVREVTHAIATTEMSETRVRQHIDDRADDQATDMSRRLSVVQESVQGHVSATSTNATESITDAIETEGFTKAVEMGLYQSQTVNALSQQVQQAQLQIQELKHLQIQSKFSNAEATRAVVSLSQGTIKDVASIKRQSSLGKTFNENHAQPETLQMQIAQTPERAERTSLDGQDFQVQHKMSTMVDREGFGTALFVQVGFEFACLSYVANYDTSAIRM